MKEYDFGLNWSGQVRENFVDFLRTSCRKLGLSFLWISDDNVRDVLRKLTSAQIRIKILLDTEATYEKKGDPYARVCYAVKDSGGTVISDPDRTRVGIDKSTVHYELVNAGVDTPYTVIVRDWRPNSRVLTEEEKEKLGTPFVIKPARGYARRGVVKDARGSVREIARARSFDRNDNFLLQEKVVPVTLGEKRAWFRVFNVFDTIIPCWWDDETNYYQHVTRQEFARYNLSPLARIVARIAEITRISWFSTEIAVTGDSGRPRFVVVDYVNDQCDMSTRSETPSGVPDPVARHTARRIVDFANRHIRNGEISGKYSIRLKDAVLTLKGLGSSPTLLKPATFNRVQI
jgi:hypothetical protein